MNAKGDLQITLINKKDNGNYLCAIRNSKGFATKSAFLTVLGKPIVKYHFPDVIKKSMKMTIRKEQLPVEQNYDFVYVSGTSLTLVLIVFVTIIFTVFAFIKIHQIRSRSLSKYQLQISPIERVNEMQYEIRNKNEFPKYWLEVGIEEDQLIKEVPEKV